VPSTCPSGMFRCSEGKCIPSLWVCNYQKDCEKGEDEFQSCSPPDCDNGQFSCGQYIFNKPYCIPPHYKCDMVIDCVDGSDESECSKIKSNHELFQLFKCVFRLDYRKCQPDDIKCGLPVNATGSSSNGKQVDICVPQDKKCDGYFDCRSGKDEDSCPGTSCRLDQFRCANGARCIDATLKCNHKNDCGDNSDEAACSKFFLSFRHIFAFIT